MKIEKLDRIVMYVKDIDEAKERFSRLLNITFEEIPAEGVEPARLEPGPKALELWQPISLRRRPRKTRRHLE